MSKEMKESARRGPQTQRVSRRGRRTHGEVEEDEKETGSAGESRADTP